MFCGHGFALESGLWMQPALNYNNSSRSEGRNKVIILSKLIRIACRTCVDRTARQKHELQ